jgi:uncharacterized alkaline shock family protein YloU
VRIFNGIVIFFYTLVFVAVGSLLISYSLGYITPQTIDELIQHLPTELNIRLIIGMIGAGIIVLSLAIMQLAFGAKKQEKSISFENPNGEVTVSLSAIEDFVRRLGGEFNEIQEIRPTARVTKEELMISCKTYLLQDLSIPEITQKIQDTVITRVKKLLGNEENLRVKIDVIKIIEKGRPSKKNKKDEQEPTAPFQYKANV